MYLGLPSDSFLIEVQVTTSEACPGLDAFKTQKKFDSSWDTFLHHVTFWHICVKNMPFEMSVFYFRLWKQKFCFILFLVLCLSCFDSLYFGSITFKLEYLYCTTLTCHFWLNYCYIYSFFHSFFLTGIFFFCFFSCSLRLIFLTCPLLLLCPTLISVFLLLLPFVQCVRHTRVHVLLLLIPFYLLDHQRVINKMPKSLAIQRTKAWTDY